MNRQNIVPLSIFFTLLFFVNCSSAEKKNLSSDDNPGLSQKIEVVKYSVKTKNSGKKKSAILKKPSGFKPAKPEVITYGNDDLKVTLYAKRFAQGSGVYAEIEQQDGGSDPESLSLSYRNMDVPVTKTSWGYRSLWGIDPEEKPGHASVIVNYKINGKNKTLASDILIRDVDFPVSKSMMNVGKFSDKNYTNNSKFKNVIAECSALLKKAFSSVTEDSIQSTLSHPRDMHKITGDYWNKRIYLKYQKKKKKKIIVEGQKRFHRGLDLKGSAGAPVFAMADGIVVLSHKMFFEGNMVIIDHGNQVFSYYQHLESRKVDEGKRVRAGEIIGGAGATGMVTGPHLHVSFMIRGVYVDPLSILYLPISR